MGSLRTPPRGGAGSGPLLESRKSCSSLGKRPFTPKEVPGDDAGGRDPRPVKRVQAKMPSTSSREVADAGGQNRFRRRRRRLNNLKESGPRDLEVAGYMVGQREIDHSRGHTEKWDTMARHAFEARHKGTGLTSEPSLNFSC